MFKIKYADSLLARELFGQLLFSHPVISRLAKEAKFGKMSCRVQWWPDWVPIWGLDLATPYHELVRRLDALTSIDDEIRWDARDHAYTVNGTDSGHRLCLEGNCVRCTEEDTLMVSTNDNTSTFRRSI